MLYRRRSCSRSTSTPTAISACRCGWRCALELPPADVAQYTVGAQRVRVLRGGAAVAARWPNALRRADARLEQASTEIADLQAFNQYVIDSLSSGLATTDADGRILTFNRAADADHRPAARRRPIGRDVGDVLQLPAAFRGDLRGRSASTRSQRADYQYRTADGRLIELGLERGARCRCPTARAATSSRSRTSPTSSGSSATRACSSGWRRSARWPPASRTRSATRWRRCRARCRCCGRSCRSRASRRS